MMHVNWTSVDNSKWLKCNWIDYTRLIYIEYYIYWILYILNKANGKILVYKSGILPAQMKTNTESLTQHSNTKNASFQAIICYCIGFHTQSKRKCAMCIFKWSKWEDITDILQDFSTIIIEIVNLGWRTKWKLW